MNRLPLWCLTFIAFAVSLATDGKAEPHQVTATTGMVGDLIVNIGGPRVEVTSLMGPGVDPHLYKATQGDMLRLSRADAIFYNGLHLEGKMTDILQVLARKKRVFAVAEKIPKEALLMPEGFEGAADPHVWFDVSLWKHAAEAAEGALAEFFPEYAGEFRERGARYRHELDELHRWTKEQIQTIPESGRLLVTAHDAFGYFGKAYGIEVVGLQGISTASEFGLYDLKQVTDLVVNRKVKAVFVESSVPKRFIEALQEGVVARGHSVTIGGELYSDALGEAGTPAGRYLGMVRHNVTTIVNALR